MHDGRPVDYGPCDPAANQRRRRADATPEVPNGAPFDPIAALLAKARQETPHE
jgi:hypothetical protein